MPDNPAANPNKEAFIDLLSYLEMLETQTGALLQFLKDNGIASDDKLAPYLEQASKASDVRMRAARARMEHLFAADDKAKPATEAVPAPPKNESSPRELPRQDEPSQKKEAESVTPLNGKRAGNRSASEQKPSEPDKNSPSEIVSATMVKNTGSSAHQDENRSQEARPPDKNAA